MEAIVPWRTEDAFSSIFDIGAMRVAVIPAGEGRLAHFLAYRPDPATRAPVLIGSGSTHDTASCVEQATMAARRAGSLL